MNEPARAAVQGGFEAPGLLALRGPAVGGAAIEESRLSIVAWRRLGACVAR